MNDEEKQQRQWRQGRADGYAGHPFPDLAVGDKHYTEGYETGRQQREAEASGISVIQTGKGE